MSLGVTTNLPVSIPKGKSAAKRFDTGDSFLRGTSEVIEAHNLDQAGSTPAPATNSRCSLTSEHSPEGKDGGLTPSGATICSSCNRTDSGFVQIGHRALPEKAHRRQNWLQCGRVVGISKSHRHEEMYSAKQRPVAKAWNWSTFPQSSALEAKSRNAIIVGGSTMTHSIGGWRESLSGVKSNLSLPIGRQPTGEMLGRDDGGTCLMPDSLSGRSATDEATRLSDTLPTLSVSTARFNHPKQAGCGSNGKCRRNRDGSYCNWNALSRPKGQVAGGVCPSLEKTGYDPAEDSRRVPHPSSA